MKNFGVDLGALVGMGALYNGLTFSIVAAAWYEAGACVYVYLMPSLVLGRTLKVRLEEVELTGGRTN